MEKDLKEYITPPVLLVLFLLGISLMIVSPVYESYYTDDAKTDEWITNENFPDRDMFKSAMVDYSYNYGKSAAWYHVCGTEEFNATLDSAFSSVWAGDMTMKDAIAEYKDELQGIFDENNAQ